jgi:hypothetical protein
MPKQLTRSLLWGPIVSKSTLSRPQSRKEKEKLTGEMPHLRILPRTRLCQNLARRNAPQVFGYVPAERILAPTRRRRWALRRGGGLLSEEGRRGGEEAALCEADVVRQPAP